MIDLHLHIDGSLPLKTVQKLARLANVPLPPEEEGLWDLLSVPADCASLNDYLRCFDLPVELLQSAGALSLAVQELVEELRAQGLLYAELRFAPSQHTRKGLTQRQVVEAALSGRKAAGGENFCQLILCCMRGGEEAANRETVDVAASFLGQGVCALDLAGAEALLSLIHI